MKWFGKMVVTGILIATAYHANAGGGEDDLMAEQALRELSNYASSLKSYQLDAIVTQTINMSGAVSEKNGRVKVWRQQPSYINWVVQSPTWSTEIICDGIKCQRYLSTLKQYTLAPISGRVDPEVLSLASPYGTIFSAMLATDPSEMLAPGRRGKARFVGLEMISNLPCKHLRFESASSRQEIWIADGPRPLPLKTIATIGPPSGLPEDGPQATTEIIYRWLSLNTPFPMSTFHISPPPDAQKVETLLAKKPVSGSPAPAKAQAAPAPPAVAVPAPVVMGSAQGSPAPDFSLPLLGGGTLKLSALRGKKVVILDFWATWCGPCQQAMPIVAETAGAYRNQGVEFFAVNLGEQAGKVQSHLAAKKWNLPVALDGDGNVAKSFGVDGIPHTVVIGKDGNIKAVHVGIAANLRQLLESEIKGAIAGGR